MPCAMRIVVVANSRHHSDEFAVVRSSHCEFCEVNSVENGKFVGIRRQRTVVGESSLSLNNQFSLIHLTLIASVLLDACPSTVCFAFTSLSPPIHEALSKVSNYFWHQTKHGLLKKMKVLQQSYVSPNGGDIISVAIVSSVSIIEPCYGQKVKIHSAVLRQGQRFRWCQKESRYFIDVSNFFIFIFTFCFFSQEKLVLTLTVVYWQMSLAVAKSFQRLGGEKNQRLWPVATLRIMNNRREKWLHRKEKHLIRDQNLKDNIMAVQRRIPRSWFFKLRSLSLWLNCSIQFLEGKTNKIPTAFWVWFFCLSCEDHWERRTSLILQFYPNLNPKLRKYKWEQTQGTKIWKRGQNYDQLPRKLQSTKFLAINLFFVFFYAIVNFIIFNFYS